MRYEKVLKVVSQALLVDSPQRDGGVTLTQDGEAWVVRDRDGRDTFEYSNIFDAALQYVKATEGPLFEGLLVDMDPCIFDMVTA